MLDPLLFLLSCLGSILLLLQNQTQSGVPHHCVLLGLISGPVLKVCRLKWRIVGRGFMLEILNVDLRILADLRDVSLLVVLVKVALTIQSALELR